MEPTDETREIVLAENAPVDVDVAVVGGGPTGMTAALAAADAGLATALVAPFLDSDPRTTALLTPSVDLLDRLGAWHKVGDAAAPLCTMRIVDDTGRLPRAPEVAFDAHEVDLDQFGFNVPNDALNGAIAERLAEAGVTRIAASASGFRDGSPAVIETPTGEIRARLVIAADGSRSMVREAAGIDVRRWTYEQTAFVTTLSHERPHGNTSTEFHAPGGPFTLVPLPGERSSLVWVDRPEEVDRVVGLDPGPLAREIERRAHFILGRMSVDGPRGTIAMEGMVANAFGDGAVVLVGEAGHRFPPIGAQGLNLGLRDVAILHDLLGRAGTIGLDSVASRYDRRRRVDVGTRTLGVDLLNRSLLSEALPFAVLRTAGLTAAHSIGPLRRTMMRLGLGG
jgi:2-octaprenyl-6-methoxyphenol hydroxylase